MAKRNIILSGQTYNNVEYIKAQSTLGGYAVFRYAYDAIELPEGYEHIEYVVSRATSEFVTDYKAPAKARITLKIMPTAETSNGTVFTDKSANGFGMTFTSASTLRVYRAGTQTNLNIPTYANVETVYEMFTATGCYANGTLLGTANSGGKTSGNYLQFGESNHSLVGRIYYIQIYEDDEMVRYYVPAIDSEEHIGFYDLVGEQFYTVTGFTAP